MNEVPVVLIALNYHVANHVPKHTIPFMCTKNKQIILLTNVKQDLITKSNENNCLKIVNVAGHLQRSVSEMPCIKNFQKIKRFFLTDGMFYGIGCVKLELKEY